ncbi:MAG: alpha/beta hydrolase [Balneolaceae bacterium]
MRNDKIFKNETARAGMEEWYQRFLTRIDARTESIKVPTSYGSSHVLITGDPSKPPLVCLHAMMTSSAHLVSELGPLLEKFRIIAPDLPGQSARGLPKRLPYKDPSHAEWLAEVLEELNLQEVHLFGVSLGGFVARQVASLNPGRVKSLTLVVPAGIVQGSLVKGLSKMAVPLMLYKISPSEKRLRNFVKHLITTWDDDWAHYLGESFNNFKANLKIPPLASDEELGKLTMPCLVIAAENDISFPGRMIIERVESQVSNVETELIPGSMHSPPTTPEFRRWLAEKVISFIQKETQPLQGQQ